MAERGAQAREEQFLGALLGLAIGDALGRPLRGLSAAEIARRHGSVREYLPLEAEEGEPRQGEITDKTEIALCLVESLTTNDGRVDPVNINARLGFLANGPSRQWMSDAMFEGVTLAADQDGLVPVDFQPDPELSVAVRGVPVGLLHAVGGFDESALERDAATVARLTHGGAVQARLTADVARAVARSARERIVVPLAIGPGDSEERLRLAKVLDIAATGASFEDVVAGAVGQGGMADTLGALAGALAGARFGASGLPQHFIDDLDARIYLTLAAPWFYRTAVRRAGTVIDLRLVE